MAYTALVRVAVLITLVTLGCSEPEAPLPTLETPAAAIRWPASPEGLPAEVERCIGEYRALARDGLPSQADGQPFSVWYTGAFQTWTTRYNDARARCDDVFAAQDAGTAGAQIMLATQSYLHERLAERATVYEEEPQMFVMAQYWSLGAACTYQSCRGGPDRAWAQLCTQRAQRLPPCPPVEREHAE